MKKTMIYILLMSVKRSFITITLILGLSLYTQARPVVMKSPDAGVNALLAVEDGNLYYKVYFHDKEVIGKSRLGFIIDGDTIGRDVSIKLIGRRHIKERYETRGFHSIAVNHANEYTYHVQTDVMDFQWQARLYEDGFAFRYLFHEQGSFHIDKELTTFTPPCHTPVWYFERHHDYKLKTYAGVWTRTVNDSLFCITPQGPVQGGLMTFELPDDRYMMITESALYNYSGMRFMCHPNATMTVDFTEGEKGFDVAGNCATPWRTIILANGLNELVNNDVPTNLNPDPDGELFADKSYIKPGRSVWSFWSSYYTVPAYLTMPYEKHFVDRAAELGFEYITIDDPWETRWPDKWKALREFCDYAAIKDVHVFVWKRSSELNIPANDYRAIDIYLDSLRASGAVGIKVDYMDSEAKQLIEFEEQVLKKAAQRRLMVDFHGCQSPTGEFRKYPNEITREGIRGLELNPMGQPIPSNHNVALLFTRCVMNNADYTPIGFSNPGNTTWTHQLATAYAFTSPLMVMAEHVDTLFNTPNLLEIVPLIKHLPTIWDETIVLEGSSISKRAILARRKKTDWFLIVLNGSEEKDISVKLDFLGKGLWKVLEAADNLSKSRRINVREFKLRAHDIMDIHLEPNGGYVAMMTPIHH